MRPCLLLAIVVVAAPAVARGEGRDQARTLFIRGQEHFDRGLYRMAIEEFRESYALSPRPLLLYDMGLAALELHQQDEALTYLHRFLATADHPSAERRNAELLVAKLERGEHRAPPPSPESPPPITPTSPRETQPPATTPPPVTTTPTTPPTVTPPPATPDVVTAAPPAATAKLRSRRGLIIGLTVGAVVVAGGAIALGVVFGTGSGPVPTIGNGHLQ